MLTPETVQIETTNACNAACIMCPHTKLTRPIGVMSDEIFRLAIDSITEINDGNVKLFMHKEGEPLLDKKISDRIKYAKQKLPKAKGIVMNTNAMLLSEEVSKKIIDSGLDTIFFSVDGATAETYNKIRVGLDYNTVEKNILKFFELRKNKKPRIIMQMLVNSENEHEVSLFKEKWLGLGCEVYAKRMHCYLDGGASSFPEPSKYEQIDVCEDPFKMAVIYVDGSVGICCWDYNNLYKIGNIKDHSLLELFNNDRFVELRIKQLQRRCSEIEPCNRCRRIFGHDAITGERFVG